MMRANQADDGWADELLVGRLAAGDHAALGPLYGRHAGFVFNLAAQTIDRTAAEEIVQEVFLTVWRRADTFDPARGTFRAWVHRITQMRVLNELRRRGRRPRAAPDPDGAQLEAVADPGPDPADVVWLDDRRAALQAAMASLSPPQQEAVRMAFFDELTHQQVASALELRLEGEGEVAQPAGPVVLSWAP
jgi:RNA polymerase sigma-70 factor (ECF subfamily)